MSSYSYKALLGVHIEGERGREGERGQERGGERGTERMCVYTYNHVAAASLCHTCMASCHTHTNEVWNRYEFVMARHIAHYVMIHRALLQIHKEIYRALFVNVT